MSDSKTGKGGIWDKPVTSYYARKQESAQKDIKASLNGSPLSNPGQLKHQEE